MKLTAIILLMACLQVSANGYGQVTFSGKDVPLEKVFAAITKQTGYSFFYNSDEIKKARPVTLDVKDMSVEEVLAECLKSQPFDYNISSRTIFILPKKNSSQLSKDALQPIEYTKVIDVSGRVINEKGEPMSGVTVTIKGSGTSTMTNGNGEFSLGSVDPEAILVFTHVSMETFEIKVSGKTELAINLKTKISALGDVTISINTGYQKIGRERFTGSYSLLDSQSFHLRPGTNILERLNGMVPGILFNKKDGASPIQIRGLSTLRGVPGTSTDPLIVLDDFPMARGFDLSKINPNDVESITILKDAASASIWGARAGNGVIVVTTKKGSFNQKLRISLSSNVTVEEKPDLFYVPRISSSEFIGVEQYLYDNGFYSGNLADNITWPVTSTAVEIMDRKAKGLISEDEATSQLSRLGQSDIRNELNKDIYRRAIRQQHFLSLDGGTQSLAYHLSLGFNTNLNNIQRSNHDDQYTLNSSVVFRPARFLEFETGINYVQENIQRAEFSAPDPLSPYSKLIDEDGNSLAIPYKYRQAFIDTVGSGTLLDWHYRPIDEIRNADNKTYTNNIRFNFGAAVNFTKWLKGKVNYQYTLSNVSFTDYQSLERFSTRDLINHFTNPFASDPNLQYPVPVGGIIFVTNSRINTYNLRGSLQVNKNLGDHEISGLIAAEMMDTKGFSNSQSIYGYNNLNGSSRSNIDYYNFYPVTYGAFPGTVDLIPNMNGSSESDVTRFVSILANAGYSYKNKYFLFATARRDGANIFGVNTNNKWKPLWSVGSAWEISREPFYHMQAVSYLKLRASYGYMGNVNNILSGKLVITNNPTPARFTNLPFSTVGTTANPDLRWEEVKTINFGVDFKLFNEKLSGTFEIFRKNSKDVIIVERLAPSVGLNSYPLNSAALKSNGFDFLLRYAGLDFAGFSISSSVGVSYAKTVVSKYSTTVRYKAQDFVNYGFNTTEGQILYGLSSFKWAGLDPTNGDPQGIFNGRVSKDYNAIFGDSIGNQVFHGSALPLYSGFWMNSISYKGFSIDFNITGKFKYYFREPSLNLIYGEKWTDNNYLLDYNRRWQTPGDENFTTVPSMSYPNPGNGLQRSGFYNYSSIHVKRADNIRLQFVNLSYKWDNRNFKKIPVNSIRLFFNIDNLNVILWRTEKSPYDPEFNIIGVLGSGGPIPKTYTGGITVNF